jgi:hypothetical protein
MLLCVSAGIERAAYRKVKSDLDSLLLDICKVARFFVRCDLVCQSSCRNDGAEKRRNVGKQQQGAHLGQKEQLKMQMR